MMTKAILFLEMMASGRLDKALADACARLDLDEKPAVFDLLSRTRIQQLVKTGQVERVGARGDARGVIVTDPNGKARKGELYRVTLPSPEKAAPKAQEMPLAIVYEDEDLLVLDKPAGLVVHPAAGNWDHTLVNALLAHCGASLSGIGGIARPGIVHRLDKDTSGLLVVAKNDRAHRGLTAQFADRSLSRTYKALVWGVPTPLEGSVEGAIGRHPRARQKMAMVQRGGKEALTHYKTLEVFGTLASLVECRLATGRTHQIRVHMESIGHPVVGDPLYGSRRRAIKRGEKGLVALLEAFPRQALHAGEIKFIHPVTDKPMKFKAPFPKDMEILLKALRQGV